MKHVPHFPTYEEATHDHAWQGAGARYAIDWTSTEERRYKEPVNGIRIYENNVVEVLRNGYRAPYWRENVKNQFGLDFVLLKDLTDVSFFDGETGVPVKKNQITADMLLRFKDRLYTMKNWGGSILFLHPDAQPVARKSVEYKVRNKRRECDKRNSLKEHTALGETLVQMKGNRPEWRCYAGLSYQTFTALETPAPKKLTTTEAQEFCIELALCPTAVERRIVEVSKDCYTAPYLLIKEKK